MRSELIGNFPTAVQRLSLRFFCVMDLYVPNTPSSYFPRFFLSSVLPLHTHPILVFFPIPVFLIPAFQTGPKGHIQALLTYKKEVYKKHTCEEKLRKKYDV